MICGSGYGGMKRFLSMSRRDTYYAPGKRKRSCHTRPTNNGRPVISSTTHHARRRPKIAPHRRHTELCFGQDVMGPIVIVLIAVLVIAGVVVSATGGAGSLGILILGLFGALLAGGVVANAIFGRRRAPGHHARAR